ncbi:Translationally-controlled tumor protein [Penicillium sp. IBT 18751x]|uniref:Translationally-controlled tumor protein n=1 Tax=Penicillium maclennaniae TaxID=1343394 RepID=UPI00254075C8|nr:Translationally-controlled tumor protein [Penicillium maclennaniae]KAJ5676492.1 Translationally-controlled tumor protein [Penicillium maclennaniae]KAJ6121187.1 Translationally-controlled tumor protein [Penicillium sp. IBT 18751x]
MIIYEDIISGDEILSDTFNIKPAADCPILWETDCRKYLKKANEDFTLEGANPSAEDGEEEGGEGEAVMVHDIEDQFRLVWLKQEEGLKPSKDGFKSHLKTYLKKVMKKLEENGAPAESIAEFKAGAPAAMKKILANYDNYDVLMGQSMDGDAMHVLIDFREDGVTPYATVWKHGFKETKV